MGRLQFFTWQNYLTNNHICPVVIGYTDIVNICRRGSCGSGIEI